MHNTDTPIKEKATINIIDSNSLTMLWPFYPLAILVIIVHIRPEILMTSIIQIKKINIYVDERMANNLFILFGGLLFWYWSDSQILSYTIIV